MKLPKKYIEQINAPVSLAEDASLATTMKDFINNEEIAGALDTVTNVSSDDEGKLHARMDEMTRHTRALARSIVQKAGAVDLPFDCVLQMVSEYVMASPVSGDVQRDLRFEFQMAKMDQRARDVVLRMLEEDPGLVDAIRAEAEQTGFAAEYERHDPVNIISFYVASQIPAILGFTLGKDCYVPKAAEKDGEQEPFRA